MPPEDWSQREVEIVVEDYLTMLRWELRGQEYNKAERNRDLQKLLPARSRGSIEFKHQNISAVMLEMWLPYVAGYKPRRNLQNLLRDVVERRVAGMPDLTKMVSEVVQAPARKPDRIADILALEVEPPNAPEKKLETYAVSPPSKRVGFRRNFLEIEARNQSLGLAGEELVLEFEQQRLWRAGRKDLSRKVDHVARSEGDGLGFDIRSFETTGRDRLIEVKTTRFGPLTPFFTSRTEVDVSEERREDYHVYRVFDFLKSPRLFTLSGSIRENCRLDVTEYRATLSAERR